MDKVQIVPRQLNVVSSIYINIKLKIYTPAEINTILTPEEFPVYRE